MYRPRNSRFRPLTAFTLLASFGMLGCKTTESYTTKVDSTVARHAKDGEAAFNEGLIPDAVKEYKQARLRAWAIDNPFESGTAAYNLAACLVVEEQCDEARLLLVDARFDLYRARASTSNTWLLSANIAMAQGRFDDARSEICFAAQAGADCEFDQQYRLVGPAAMFIENNCHDPYTRRFSLIEKKIRRKKEIEDCQREHMARIQLAMAKLASAQLDIDSTKAHLQKAHGCSQGICNLTMQAEHHEISAQIYDLEANYLQAGAHRDCEVAFLVAAGEYLEIPRILEAAADSYFTGGRKDLAVDRLIRCARIYLARQKYQKSCDQLQRAREWIEPGLCQANEIRFAITAKVLDDHLTKISERTMPLAGAGSVPGEAMEEVEKAPETKPFIGPSAVEESSIRVVENFLEEDGRSDAAVYQRQGTLENIDSRMRSLNSDPS
jgi:tetratricopeptide (TPR) repeat protein